MTAPTAESCAAPVVATPLNTDWQFLQYQMPTAAAAPQIYTPNTAAASTWPGSSAPAHSHVSGHSAFDIIMQDTGTSVSQ
eukprot:4863147-Prorocentrum_lima.AAC.1